MAGLTLTNDEREKVRYFLGYLNADRGYGLSLGIPSVSQLGFLVEGLMNRLLPEAVPRVRSMLAELDCIEEQLKDVRVRLTTKRTDGVELRGREEIEDLLDLMEYWCSALADQLGAEKNVFSKRLQFMRGQTFVVEPS